MQALDLMAEVAQVQRDQIGDVTLVFDDEDAAVHGWGVRSGARGGRGGRIVPAGVA